MKPILIKSVTVVDPDSDSNGCVCDILIQGHLIAKIANNILVEGAHTIQGEGFFVSPGWLDMNVNFSDPGYEQKEDLHSGCAAAAAGGFTGVAVMPNTFPVIDSKLPVEYIINKTKSEAVDVYPIGAISVKKEGKDMAELFDMKTSGALAFSDGNKPVQDAGLMMRALQYTQAFNALLISYPEDASIAGEGKVNEGLNATLLGMKGIPNLAEDLMIARDISLVEYTGSRLHFTTVSTAKGVDLIRSAKKRGLPISADVAAHHLFLDDSELSYFDSNYKLKPPLRTKQDVLALKKGLKDGTINNVVSQHTPQEIEKKDVEFELAAYGMTALETTYSLLNMSCGNILTVEEIVNKLAINPRQILGLEGLSIKEGEKANLTIFDPTHEWTLTSDQLKSKGKNSPFIGSRMIGKALAIINKGICIENK